MKSAGKLFRLALQQHKPLPIVGTINAYSAIMAQKLGHKAIYLSGSGVATASFGFPDLGITEMNDVVTDARRITGASNLPLLVDIDTGFGTAFNIQRCIREMIKAGVAAVHIEDQVAEKRCGHRPGKKIVKTEEMVDRIRMAVKGRQDTGDLDFVIMARTDAFANEGLEKAVERCQAYIEAGADALFPEALTKLEHYEFFKKHFPNVPILANITEFGKTPLFSLKDLGNAGVDMVLYPLSAFRAMSKAAEKVYRTILEEGSQEKCIQDMQTRDELYKYLDYHSYESTLDDLLKK